jgi:single-stranded-DNA-specific exonuclease
MAKIWKLKEKHPKEFADKHPQINPFSLQLLYNRGLLEKDVIERFLNPQYENLYDPFLFKDMEKAVARVWEAIEKKEKIYIYSDYDADAVTANACLQQTFRYLNYPVESYIPDRFTEGYGLNLDAFEKIRQSGARLVITVDCGTNSVEVADFCRENNVDLIITDHHEITGSVPNSFALINPKNPNDNYPDDQITGVGVAYKLACAVLRNPKSKILIPKFVEGWDKWLLDLVAIGTVADCHSLFGENRILVNLGLKVLPKTKWLGLRQLMKTAGVKPELAPDTQTLGFVIAPRINAAGRLEHANIALDLLMAEDLETALSLSLSLEKINKRRQDLTLRLVSEAKEQAELLGDRKILLLKSKDWPKGVVGLVAGRLAGEYNRPVIVLEAGESESTGSARSVGDFDIVECFKFASSLLSKFGGHKQAAGLTLKTENIDEFYGAILKFAEQNLKEKEAVLDLEAELEENGLHLSTFDSVLQLEPFGAGNQKPKFLISKTVLKSFRAVGQAQKHLQFQVSVGSLSLEGIAFNMAYLNEQFKIGDNVDLAVELLQDAWNGQKKLKLRLVDIRPATGM